MKRALLVTICVCLALTACQDGDPAEPSHSAGREPTAGASTGATAPSPDPDGSDPPASDPPEPAPPSLADLTELALGGGVIVVGELVMAGQAFDRFRILYGSGDRTISGTLTRPHGAGPFPAVVSSHGYLPPEGYEVGDGMSAEENALGSAGYVVIHPDFTGYGTSTPTTRLDAALGLDYAEDILNAVVVLKSLPYVDDESVALVGRSLGGGLTLDALAGRPGMVSAAVLLSPVSSRYERVLRVLDRVGARASAPVEEEFGTPDSNPGFYDGMSSRAYFDRVAVPVLVQHGTADPLCRPEESQRTVELLDEAGVDARLMLLPGQRHIYRGAGEQLSIESTIEFLDAQLKS